MKSLSLLIKRSFDILTSILLLVLLSPIFIVISMMIWITMGKPIFYQQMRLGYQGKQFKIIKFRTMDELWDQEEILLPDDQRMTKTGKFLRSTTLDELPGLINILLGNMSAVGPRPLLVEYKDLYTPEQWRRHEVRPGMAGPVLAGGRNTLSWEEKFKQDIWYVDNWSLWLDIKILVKTALRVLKREGINAEGYATMPKFTGSNQSAKGDQ